MARSPLSPQWDLSKDILFFKHIIWSSPAILLYFLRHLPIVETALKSAEYHV